MALRGGIIPMTLWVWSDWGQRGSWGFCLYIPFLVTVDLSTAFRFELGVLVPSRPLLSHPLPCFFPNWRIAALLLLILLVVY